MDIDLKKVQIRDLIKDYSDMGMDGVYGYGGKLNIRPPYQREFIYKTEQRNKVIDTIMHGFPLNVMYWSVNEHKGAMYPLEVLDGQQRIISICQFANREFTVKDHKEVVIYADDLGDDFLNYELTVYFCTGSDREKMQWFETINIAGEKLSAQELRNAVYSGRWVTEAKRWFSNPGWGAYNDGKKYLSNKLVCDRQHYLEQALKWVVNDKKTSIEEYMRKHRDDTDADSLKLYFQEIIDWVKRIFPKHRNQMMGVDWQKLYESNKNRTDLNPRQLEARVSELMKNDEVKSKSGIWSYVLDGDESHLKLRTFSQNLKSEKYEEQKGICANKKCLTPQKIFKIEEMHADHKISWKKGGKTEAENCQLLCSTCNLKKSYK